MPKKNELKFYTIIVFSILLSGFGFVFGIKLADQLSTKADERSPASQLNAAVLENFNYKKLFDSVTIYKSLDAQGIEFGSLYTTNSQNKLEFVCNTYPKMELHFKAEGMAVSGEIPKMLLSGPCIKHKSKDKIEALLINANTIMTSTPKDKTLRSTQNQVQIDFSDLSDSWPPTWLLSEIHFINSDEGDKKKELIITSSEIREAGITIQLEW